MCARFYVDLSVDSLAHSASSKHAEKAQAVQCAPMADTSHVPCVRGYKDARTDLYACLALTTISLCACRYSTLHLKPLCNALVTAKIVCRHYAAVIKHSRRSLQNLAQHACTLDRVYWTVGLFTYYLPCPNNCLTSLGYILNLIIIHVALADR